MTSENIGWDPLRVEVLWDLKEPPRRGPKPTLTVRQIAETGVEIADRVGLAALSMQRLADELGVGTMTLYTYIPDKAALLEVMLDLAYTDATPPLTLSDWRHYLELGAAAMMQVYQRHPWTLQVFVGGPPLGPAQMRYLEAALQALSDTRLEDEEKLDVVMAVSSYVRGTAHISVGIIEHESRSGLGEEELQAEYARAYNRVLDPDLFPMTSRLLAASPGDTIDNSYDFGFEFGLSRLLDGIERHIESRA